MSCSPRSKFTHHGGGRITFQRKAWDKAARKMGYSVLRLLRFELFKQASWAERRMHR